MTTATATELHSSPSLAQTATHAASTRLIWILAIQIPSIVALGWFLWARPHYQFFPIAVLGAVLLAWTRLRDEVSFRPGRKSTILILLSSSLVLQTGALLIHSYWLIGISLPISLTAFLYAVGNWSFVRRCWPSLGLLVMVVPPPFGLDLEMVAGLRTLTANLGSHAMNTIGLLNLRNGNVITVGERDLFVEEACSGVNSLLSSLCCVLIWSGLTRSHWAVTLVLFGAAFFWLLIANVLRVTLVATSLHWWGVDLSSGWQHDTLGVCTFVLGLFMTWSTAQLLFFAGRRHPFYDDKKTPKTIVPGARELPWPRVPLSSPGGMLIFSAATLVTFSFVVLYRDDFIDWDAGRSELIVDRLGELVQDDLPGDIQGLRIEEFKTEKRGRASTSGEHSRTWRGIARSTRFLAAVDYPFDDWHELTNCYRGQGWEIVSSKDVASPNDAETTIKEVFMKREGYQTGYLLFALFDANGTTIPSNSTSNSFWLRPGSLLGQLAGRGRPEKTVPSYQVQTLVVGSDEPDPVTRQTAKELFKRACGAARSRLTEGNAPHSFAERGVDAAR